MFEDCKITKGEWYSKETEEYLHPSASRMEICSNESNGWICKIQNNGTIGKEEGLANANLILAAKLLLVCCIDQLRILELNPTNDNLYQRNKLKQAIEKAGIKI